MTHCQLDCEISSNCGKNVTASNVDWLIALSVSFMIGQSDNFAFGFKTYTQLKAIKCGLVLKYFGVITSNG